MNEQKKREKQHQQQRGEGKTCVSHVGIYAHISGAVTEPSDKARMLFWVVALCTGNLIM